MPPWENLRFFSLFGPENWAAALVANHSHEQVVIAVSIFVTVLAYKIRFHLIQASVGLLQLLLSVMFIVGMHVCPFYSHIVLEHYWKHFPGVRPLGLILAVLSHNLLSETCGVSFSSENNKHLEH